MDPKPKILILHASAGHGHWKAAQALEEALRRDHPGYGVELLDALDFLPPGSKRAYAGSYLFLIRRFPWIWKCLYEASDVFIRFAVFRWIRRLCNSLVAQGLERKIRRDQPVLIFTTHFFPTEVAAAVTRKDTRTRTVAVITDFLVHRFWVLEDIAAYAVALPETKRALEKMGIPGSRIHVTGIPVRAKFSESLNGCEIRAKLGIDPEDHVVLFTSGGAGAVLSEEDISSLLEHHAHVQILVVCGHNQALYDAMRSLSRKYPQVKPFAFVENMHELMEASDVVVGKAGGLTVSEALVRRRAFVVMDPVPGQEVHNAACLETSGAGRWVRSARDLLPAIEGLLFEPSTRERMLKSQDAIRRPAAARDIVQLGLRLVEASSSSAKDQ